MKIIVSIIIPFYENMYLLKKTINSILKQSFKKYEVIIIHDNPKGDGGLLEKLSHKKNFTIIYNKKNLGAGPSRNKGINISKGKYIAFLDSDDTWHDHKLLKQINYMEKKNYLVTHTTYDIVDENGRYISSRVAQNLNYKKLLNSCDIGLSTVILHKKILKNKIFPNIKTKEDYVLWLKIAKSGVIFYGINLKLTKWRDTPSSLSKSSYIKIKDAFRVYYTYEQFNLIKTIFRVLILSVNFLKKKWQ